MILKIDDRIRARQVEFWNNFKLSLNYNSIASSFAFDFYFNEQNIEHIELACIGHYHIAQIEHNGELLLTGNILNETFASAKQKTLVPFSGYSLSGVLEDCNIPLPLFPLQYNNLTLSEIATKMLEPFKLTYSVDSSVLDLMNEPYAKVEAEPTQTVKDFLSKLASQKNIVVTHDATGNLLFTRAKTSQNPILDFSENGVPFTSMKLSYNGQLMHSHITVMKEASSKGGNAGQFTIRNPYVPYIYRPKNIVQTSGTDNDTELAAKTALSQELRGLVLTITTDRWEVDGKVIKPNNIITVKNNQVYLYESVKWFIEKVELTGDKDKTVATLTCVLPEVYSMEEARYLFKEVNLH